MATNAQGKIITFYSYKGGVGRSMILANVAWILASNGKKVLVIDWDLDAPSLHRYFQPFLLDKDLSATKGLIDFFNKFIDAALTPPDETEEDDENWYKPYTNLRPYAVPLDWEFPQQGTIDFVPAGKQVKLYAMRVTSFDWDLFYERFQGGIFLETVKDKMRADYDYILIDSRTGIGDPSGICTVQMPDSLVVFFTANNQSISGAVGIARSVNKQWQQDHDENHSQNNRVIFPVFSRTDRTKKDKLDLARDYIKFEFTPFLQQHLSKTEVEDYWRTVEIPYISWYAYEEVLATFDETLEQRESLLSAIEPFVTYLTNKKVTKLVAPNKEEREDILSQFAR
jgi:cellulose biosynthesis protein BcsQ